ncbi:cohesin domain-containing protein [Paenibacillus sp. LHD-117]|uniref:Ig-like domain-containing protein n=1 Tax=Paenibacillus sp. LHD-117 TaxID=3071412 RepID=UPI0027E14A2F|nr:Ig-like domain-containing protein [Paenibacillus sp. LHD-117]MDQ6421588.1 cohesin domain-containing protein [Paenibacillus sp. LHD-117]
MPTGFVATNWHEFQIQTYGGKVGFVVDGTTILSVNDGSYSTGGVAFGGINSTVLLDDIKIISNPTYVEYGSNFNLGNVSLSGTYNPNYSTYGTTVSDNSQPVTLIKPKPVLSGVSQAVTFNGVDITAHFPDYTTEVALENVKNGRNKLVISEITSAGSKDYTIYIDKTYTISSVAAIAPVSTVLGTAPVLPTTTNVTFEDGTNQTAAIRWDRMSPAAYKNTTGTFTVTGQLVGLNGKVSTTVNVVGLESIGELEDVTTVAGTAPVLAETISAQYTNESKDLPLIFAEFDPAMFANAGTIIAVANVEGYPGTVLQKVIVEEAPVTTDYTLTATGADSVIAGNSFDVTYTLNNVAEHVYALDQTIHYDPAQVEFLTAEALQSGFTIVGQQEGEGEVRILLASSGAGGAIKQTAPVLKLNFKANPVGTSVTSSVYVTDAAVADANGIETTVDNGTPHEITIVVVDKAALQTLIASAQAAHDAAAEGAGVGQYPAGSKAILQSAIDLAKAVAGQSGATQEQVDQAIAQLQAALQAFRDSVNAAVAGDLNGDGKVSLGDLGIIASSYGKKSTDADWAMYEKADMNDDGKIDIVDLAAIARLILG